MAEGVHPEHLMPAPQIIKEERRITADYSALTFYTDNDRWYKPTTSSYYLLRNPDWQY